MNAKIEYIIFTFSIAKFISEVLNIRIRQGFVGGVIYRESVRAK